MNTKNPKSEQPEKLSTTEARQALPTYNFRVLIISIAVVAVAFAGAYVFGEATDESDPSRDQTQSQSMTDVEPPPAVPTEN